jgi:hypothetical protein
MTEERQVVVPATLAGEGGEGFVFSTLHLLQIKAVVGSSTAVSTSHPGEICLPQMILSKAAGLVRCLSLSSL